MLLNFVAWRSRLLIVAAVATAVKFARIHLSMDLRRAAVLLRSLRIVSIVAAIVAIDWLAFVLLV